MFSKKKSTFALLSIMAIMGVSQSTYSMQKAAVEVAQKACMGIGGSLVAYNVVKAMCYLVDSRKPCTSSTCSPQFICDDCHSKKNKNAVLGISSYCGGALIAGGPIGLAGAITFDVAANKLINGALTTYNNKSKPDQK